MPISTGVSGLGTGIAAALAVNTGSAGSTVLFNGALGTPTSGTLTNATGLPEAGLTLSDNTTNDASTARHGFLPKLSNIATEFLNGQGAFSTPSSSGISVGFTASLTSTATNATGDGTVFDIVSYTEQSDISSNFNATTGVFTAPSDGLYLFFLVVQLSNLSSSHTDGYTRFTDGSNNFYISRFNPYTYDGTTAVPIVSGIFIAQLTASTTIKAQVQVTGGTKTVSVNGTTTRFGGFKIA